MKYITCPQYRKIWEHNGISLAAHATSLSIRTIKRRLQELGGNDISTLAEGKRAKRSPAESMM